MWVGKQGPCTCAFCDTNRPHPTGKYHDVWDKKGHLQVAESLDRKDILWTRICETCTHEEREN